MELKTWTPVFELERDLRSMFDRLPRFFGDGDFDFRPTVDMKREGEMLVITTELPGIDPDEDVDVTLDGDLLIIRGEKSTEKKIEEEDHFLHERRFGRFERRLPMPEGVDPDKIEATYDKGVLIVRVPVPVEAVQTTKKIPIGSH